MGILLESKEVLKSRGLEVNLIFKKIEVLVKNKFLLGWHLYTALQGKHQPMSK